MNAIERPTSLRQEERLQEKQLRDMLEKLFLQECKAPGLCSEDIKKTKQKLELVEEEGYRGALVRARAVDWAAAETPTKRGIAIKRVHARGNQIQEVEWDDAVDTDNGGIHRAFFQYYQALFAQHEVDVRRFKDEFLGAMPRLDDSRKESLELPITEQEVQSAIENLSPGKSPGPDGLSAAFYKSLKRELTPLLTFYLIIHKLAMSYLHLMVRAKQCLSLKQMIHKN